MTVVELKDTLQKLNKIALGSEIMLTIDHKQDDLFEYSFHGCHYDWDEKGERTNEYDVGEDSSQSLYQLVDMHYETYADNLNRHKFSTNSNITKETIDNLETMARLAGSITICSITHRVGSNIVMGAGIWLTPGDVKGHPYNMNMSLCGLLIDGASCMFESYNWHITAMMGAETMCRLADYERGYETAKETQDVLLKDLLRLAS